MVQSLPSEIIEETANGAGQCVTIVTDAISSQVLGGERTEDADADDTGNYHFQFQNVKSTM